MPAGLDSLKREQIGEKLEIPDRRRMGEIRLIYVLQGEESKLSSYSDKDSTNLRRRKFRKRSGERQDMIRKRSAEGSVLN